MNNYDMIIIVNRRFNVNKSVGSLQMKTSQTEDKVQS